MEYVVIGCAVVAVLALVMGGAEAIARFINRRKFPLTTWVFEVKGGEWDRVVDQITITANYEPQAAYDAEQAFQAIHGVPGHVTRSYEKNAK